VNKQNGILLINVMMINQYPKLNIQVYWGTADSYSLSTRLGKPGRQYT